MELVKNLNFQAKNWLIVKSNDVIFYIKLKEVETKLQIVACGFFIAYTTFKFRRLKHTHFLREKCWWKFHSCLLFHLINHESVKWWHFEKTSSQSYSSVDKNDSCHTIGNGAIIDHFPILAHFWRENSNCNIFGDFQPLWKPFKSKSRLFKINFVLPNWQTCKK